MGDLVIFDRNGDGVDDHIGAGKVSARSYGPGTVDFVHAASKSSGLSTVSGATRGRRR